MDAGADAAAVIYACDPRAERKRVRRLALVELGLFVWVIVAPGLMGLATRQYGGVTVGAFVVVALFAVSLVLAIGMFLALLGALAVELIDARWPSVLVVRGRFDAAESLARNATDVRVLLGQQWLTVPLAVAGLLERGAEIVARCSTRTGRVLSLSHAPLPPAFRGDGHAPAFSPAACGS